MCLRPPQGRLDCILLKISYACFTYIIQHHLTLNSIKFKLKIQKNVKRLCIMPCPQTFDAYLPCLNSFYDLETRPLALWLVIRFVRYKRVLSSTRKSLGTNVKFSRFISCVNTLHLLDCGPHPFNLCRFGPKRALSLNQHIYPAPPHWTGLLSAIGWSDWASYPLAHRGMVLGIDRYYD